MRLRRSRSTPTMGNISGVGRDAGDYAQHVQCPWRMTLKDEIITGRGDIFCAPERVLHRAVTDYVSTDVLRGGCPALESLSQSRW